MLFLVGVLVGIIFGKRYPIVSDTLSNFVDKFFNMFKKEGVQ